jgi:hypothetical protein
VYFDYPPRPLEQLGGTGTRLYEFSTAIIQEDFSTLEKLQWITSATISRLELHGA